MPDPFATLNKNLHATVFPAWVFLRRNRLRPPVQAGESDIPEGRVRLRLRCSDPACDFFVEHTRNHLATYKRGGAGRLSLRDRFAPTPCVLDLAEYPTFAAYSKAVSKRNSNDVRKIRKALREGGVTARLIEPLSHQSGIQAITRSKLIRSGTPVLAAWLDWRKLPPDTFVPPARPRCDEHWTLEWGVFERVESGERLVARIAIRRCGDFVRTLHIMGHGEARTPSVSRLALFELVRWFLESGEPCASGVRSFRYGAVEHGRRGVFDWKRRLLFFPRLLLPASPSDGPSEAHGGGASVGAGL